MQHGLVQSESELELLTHLRHQLWKPCLLVGQNPFPFTVLLARFGILYEGSWEGCRLVSAIFSNGTSHLATPLLRKFIYIVTITSVFSKVQHLQCVTAMHCHLSLCLTTGPCFEQHLGAEAEWSSSCTSHFFSQTQKLLRSTLYTEDEDLHAMLSMILSRSLTGCGHCAF